MPSIPCVCSHCGSRVAVPQLQIGQAVPCPNCHRSFRAQFSMTAEPQPETIRVRQLEFTCAMNNKKFTSVFRLVPAARKYQLWETEHGTGTLDRGAYGSAAREGRVIVVQEPDQAVFAQTDFDFAQWSCVWCGQKNFYCCNLGHMFCKARQQRNDYAVCPACGDAGYYTDPVDTLSGASATFKQPRPTIGANPQTAARAAIQPRAAARIAAPIVQSAPVPRLTERIQRLLLPGGSWKG